MPETVQLNVTQGNSVVPMAVSTSEDNLSLDSEKIRVIKAVSPVIDLERNDLGVRITVADIEGTKWTMVFNGDPGPKGDTGPQGPQGAKGEDGYTPVRGVDYATEEDLQYIVEKVLEALVNNKEAGL